MLFKYTALLQPFSLPVLGWTGMAAARMLAAVRRAHHNAANMYRHHAVVLGAAAAAAVGRGGVWLPDAAHRGAAQPAAGQGAPLLVRRRPSKWAIVHLSNGMCYDASHLVWIMEGRLQHVG